MKSILKKFWKYIVAALIIGASAAQLAPGEVAVVGSKHFVRCLNGVGDIVEHDISETEYTLLRTSPIPQYPNETCTTAYRRWKYDTLDGDIHEGDYVITTATWYIRKNSIEKHYLKSKYPTINSALLKAGTITEQKQQP